MGGVENGLGLGDVFSPYFLSPVNTEHALKSFLTALWKHFGKECIVTLDGKRKTGAVTLMCRRSPQCFMGTIPQDILRHRFHFIERAGA